MFWPAMVRTRMCIAGKQNVNFPTKRFGIQNCKSTLTGNLILVSFLKKVLTQFATKLLSVFFSTLIYISLFRGCYGKKFGAKGYGFAGGSGFLQTGDL